jgi:hypothetical protein
VVHRTSAVLDGITMAILDATHEAIFIHRPSLVATAWTWQYSALGVWTVDQ